MSGDHNMYQKDIPFASVDDEIARLQRTLQRQEKDIEHLTYACQLLLRRNKELLDEQRRNSQAVV